MDAQDYIKKCEKYKEDPQLMSYYVHGSFIPQVDDLKAKGQLKHGKKTIEFKERHTFKRKDFDVDLIINSDPNKLIADKLRKFEDNEGFENLPFSKSDGKEKLYFSNNPILCDLEKAAKDEGLQFVEKFRFKGGFIYTGYI